MDQMTLLPLGISAGTPTRDRNVASHLLQMDGSAVLFDCGEGTQHRLMTAGWKPNAIEVIALSHLHGDHLFGLPGLLSTMSMLNRETPLTILGPRGVSGYLGAVREWSQLNVGYPIEVRDVGEGHVFAADGYDIYTRRLDHVIECLGFLVVEHDRRGRFDADRARAIGVPEGPLFAQLHRGEDVTLEDGRLVRSADVVGPTRAGRRVAYCTDTRACMASVELARNVDLLIHEATYADDMAEEAWQRFHATARQAAEVARDAAALQLLLTHFSPRYGELDLLRDEAAEVFAATSVARELTAIEIRRRDSLTDD